MNTATVGIIATVLNSLLLVLLGYFIKDLLERLRSLEKSMQTPVDGKTNERISLLEAFSRQVESEMGGVLFALSSTEQSLGAKILELQRSMDSREMENKQIRTEVDRILRDGKGTNDRLQLHEKAIRGTLESFKHFRGSMESKMVRLENLIIVKGEKK